MAGEAVGEYIITPVGDETQGNYTVTYDTAKFIITASNNITIHTPTPKTKVYNATALSAACTATTVQQSQLVSGDTVVFAALSGSRTNVGKTLVSISNATIHHYESGSYVKDVTTNYSYTYLFDTITISPRAITLKPKSYEHIFTGYTYNSDSTPSPHYNIVSGTMQGKDKIVDITITSVGESSYHVDVYDAQYPNCSQSTDVIFNRPAELTATITSSDPRCFEGEDGVIEVQMAGGSVSSSNGYTIDLLDHDSHAVRYSGTRLGGGDGPFSKTMENIADGNYDVVVTDMHHCSTDAGTVQIASPSTEYSLTAISIIKKYDGQQFNPARYVISNGVTTDTIASGNTYTFADGAILTATTSIANPLIDVVDTPNVLTYSISKNSVDVTCYYAVTTPQVPVRIVITPREVTLTSATATDTASTDEHGDPVCLTAPTITIGGDGFVQGGFYGDEGLADTVFPGTSKVCYVLEGSVPNDFNYTLKSNTKSINYEISKHVGVLSLAPKGVASITSLSYTKVYDGENIQQPGYTYNTVIAETDTILVTWDSQTTFKNVATVVNKFDTVSSSPTCFRVEEKGTGDDKTSEYTFKDADNNLYVFFGNLSITPRRVTLTTPSVTKVYDGTPLTADVTVSNYNFVEGEAVAYANTSITNVGSVIDTVKITTHSGFIASNYTIDTIQGTLKVTKRPLTITGAGDTVLYNGSLHTLTAYSLNTGTNQGLVNGHRLSGITYSVSRTAPGEATGTFTGTPQILDEYDNDVTANYDIDYAPGILKIKASNLELRIASNKGVHKYE